MVEGNSPIPIPLIKASSDKTQLDYHTLFPEIQNEGHPTSVHLYRNYKSRIHFEATKIDTS